MGDCRFGNFKDFISCYFDEQRSLDGYANERLEAQFWRLLLAG